MGEGFVKLQGTFQTLKSTLEHAQRLNQSNSELVNEQLAGIHERISILTAASVRSTAGKQDTYGPKGGINSPAGLKPRAVIR